jgi:tetratricopeptide (TPR) repeat protein
LKRLARIEMLEQMLEKEPNDLFLNYALGLEYANDLATVANAESQFRAVIELDQNYVAAYYQLGKLFESLLRVPEALEFYKKGLEKARALKDNKSVNEFEEAIFMLED